MSLQQNTLFAAPEAPQIDTVSVATWNVNSAKSRTPHLIDYLRSDIAPDILLLQEIKCVDDAFPRHIAEDNGYICETHGQKSYNGVAILSKYPLFDIERGLPGMEDDPQARFITAYADIKGSAPLRVSSVYVPNGSEPGSEKFAYKMRFFEALRAYLTGIACDEGQPVLCGGDFNAVFIPEDDVYDAARLEGSICCHEDERRFLRLIEAGGYTDVLRAAGAAAFTWWDYREGRRKRDEGYRIDHLFGNAEISDVLDSAAIDAYTRDAETPSDHAPVRCVLRLPLT